MQATIADILTVFRGARRRPGFAAAVLLTLGIGIGAAAAVFSVLDAVLVRPLPYPVAERIHGVWFASPNFPGGLSRVRQSVPTYLLIREHSRVYEAFALAERTRVTIDEDGAPTRVSAGTVTSEIFSVLRIAPLRGRAFLASDNAPGASPTVILSEALWATRFARDPAIVGKTLAVDGVQRQVVGILPDAVRFPENDVKLWIPLTVDPTSTAGLDFIFTGYGRLKPGITDAAAHKDFLRLVQLLPESYPSVFPRPLIDRLGLTALFVPLQQELVGEARRSLLIALGAIVVVLLIVVANVTNLFLVRNASRMTDYAVRAASGARPSRLLRGLVTEGLVYAFVGGVLGLGLGVAFLALLKQLGPAVIPRYNEVAFGARTVIAMAVLSTVIGFTAGILPALRVRNANIGLVLRSGGKTIGLAGRMMVVRRVLVAGQVALALALLFNAGWLVRSLAATRAVAPGFDAAQVAGLRFFLSARDYPRPEDAHQFVLRVADAVRQVPGVNAASAVSFLPLRDGRIFYPIRIEHDQSTRDLPAPRLRKIVTEDYFKTMGIRVVRGRAIDRSDIESNATTVVVNEAFAAMHWPGREAVGRRLSYNTVPGDTVVQWLDVVGVVANVRDRELTASPPPIFYTPLQPRHLNGSTWREMSIAVRGPEPAALLARVRKAVAQTDAGVPAWDARTMRQVLDDVNARARYTMLLVVCAAVSALVLAAIGLYGVLSQAVTERRREMALRIALGATPGAVRGMVVAQAVKLVGVGVVVGVVVTVFTNQVVAATLYGVRPVDVPTIAGAALLVAVLAWVSARIPAARAAAVHPSLALKEE